MLGVFGNVPAFDQYFCKGFRMHTFNEKSLLKLKEFYDENKNSFEVYGPIYTYDFFNSQRYAYTLY